MIDTVGSSVSNQLERGRAVSAARALERWGSERGWGGSDPYDGLNARWLPGLLHGSPLALRVLTQAVKRSPVDLRPALGIPDALSAVTLAHVITAYARNGFLDQMEAERKLLAAVSALARLRCDSVSEPCWGYHFNVQTRVFFYPRTNPNTIATALAGLALLDAYVFAHIDVGLELACGAAEFFLKRVPLTETHAGSYFGYLEADRTPIHNANMLICALLARLSQICERPDFARAATASLEYTVARQRRDGSWPYGEQGSLNWVDGFHTGYVLDCLLTCIESGLGGDDVVATWRRGLRFYVDSMIERDGTPRYTPTSRYPIDGQCAAQAIQTLSRATVLEPGLAASRWLVLRYACDQLADASGAFYFQRGRLWTNRALHPRWVEAPMLAALTCLVATT